MKKFIIHTVSFFFLLLAIAGILIICVPKNQDGYLFEYKKKCELMRSVPSPRIILVGGSNLAFGVNSKEIIDSLGIPVVNAGLHAGFGLKFILDNMVKYVRKGDIVVIAPEYWHFYGKNAYGETQTFPEMLDIAPSALKDLNVYQWTTIIRGSHLLVLERLSNLNAMWSKKETQQFEYKKSGFNRYGDEVSHWNFPSKPIVSGRALNKKMNEDYFLHFLQITHQLQRISKVILMPPVIEKGTFINQTKEIVLLQKELEKHKLKFIVEPINFAYPSELFFDTYHHLNKKGVDINTRKMIQMLKDSI